MTSSATANRPRAGTGGSVMSATRSVRTVANTLMQMDPPPGMWAATAQATSQAPTLGEIRRGSFGHGQLERRRSSLSSIGDGETPRRLSGARRTRTNSGLSDNSGRRLPRRSSAGLGSPVEGPLHEESFKGYGNTQPFPPMIEEPTNASESKTGFKVGDDNLISKGLPSALEKEESASTFNDKAKGSSDASDEAQLADGVCPSGYVPPPKIPWTISTWIGLKAFWKWFCTPLGFLITLYGLNVVGWGGMLFLLLLGRGAAPAMCFPDTAANNYDGCNALNSPRKIWLEIDSQILNALFCVTGFGLIPWRFRDLYYLLKWRLCSEKKKGRAAKMYGLRTLGGIHRSWFRLPGSDTVDELTRAEYERSIHLMKNSNVDSPSSSAAPAEENDIGLASLPESDERIPLPTKKQLDLPLTGVYAPPTALWKMDFFIWCQVWNTFFQVCLCGFMWGLNRYNRPSWTVGLFIALACVIAGVGGIMSFIEGKKVKKVEGVPIKVQERYEDAEREVGIEMERRSVKGLGRIERDGESVHADPKGKVNE